MLNELISACRALSRTSQQGRQIGWLNIKDNGVKPCDANIFYLLAGNRQWHTITITLDLQAQHGSVKINTALGLA